MSYTINLPNITAPTPEGQMQQMRGYLYQMAQELEFALNSVETGSVAVTGGSMAAGSGRGAALEAAERAQATFAEIKSLIIKSADIVNAYYEQMTEKFSGLYVAQSDFGTYQEATAQEITKNSQGITQAFENLQQIQTDVIDLGTTLDGIGTSVQEVRATIRTGLLYDDGTPVYGLEIGQQVTVNGVETFRKFCRLVADRLSFFDTGGNEVAYLSDNKMYVTTVEATTVKAGVLDTRRITMGDYVWIAGADGHLSLN